MEQIKEFYLQRDVDVSGMSGTGVVARGVALPSGKCVLEWLSFHSSVAIYNNLDDIVRIHGHSGATKLMVGKPGNKTNKEHKVDE